MRKETAVLRKRPRDEDQNKDLAVRKDGAAAAQPSAPTPAKEKLRLQAELEATAGPNKGQSYPLTRIITMIGRQEGCDIVLADQTVSREHGQFEQHQDEWVYTNLSENGTWVNRQKADRIVLRSGDVLEVGAETKLKFLLKEPEQVSVGPVIRRRARQTQAEKEVEDEPEAPPQSAGQVLSDTLRKRRKWVIGLGVWLLVCVTIAILIGVKTSKNDTNRSDPSHRYLTESELRQYFDKEYMTPLANNPPERNQNIGAERLKDAYINYQRKDVPGADLALYTAVKKFEEAKAYYGGFLPTDDGNKAMKTLEAARHELLYDPQHGILKLYSDAALAEVQGGKKHLKEARDFLDAIERRIEPGNKQLWAIIEKQRAQCGK